jgi:hypothetical protein
MRFLPIVLCWVAIAPSLVKAEAGGHDCSGAREFTQSFYDWYVTILSRRDSPPWLVARHERGASFTEELTRALDEDAAAQAKEPDGGYMVGLDFDPVVASQDPEDHYRVGTTSRKGAACWVEVRGLRQGSALRDQPDVLPELVHRGGRWRFANFHYPNGGDLLSTLGRLRSDREKKR